MSEDEIAHIGQVIGRRYRVIGAIDGGGMGMVYRVNDRLTGHVVALKHMRLNYQDLQYGSAGKTQDFRLSLASEFRTLASLHHPNIINVLDYGFSHDGEQRLPFFTMDYLEDAVWITHAAVDRSIAQRVDLLTQLLQALVYLHRRDILHRDLKPANVLVVGDQVKVLDFGLATARSSVERDDFVAGTLAYLPPEMLGSGEIGPQSDLYAVGLIAYEMFSGAHPFNTREMAQLLREIMEKTPDLEALDVPAAIAQIIARLLEKQPAKRYETAAEVITALRNAADLPPIQETVAMRESFLQAARFVGREQEYHRFSTALTKAIDHQGGAWLIGGESGVGKSRLLEEIRALALVQDATVLRGQAVAEAGGLYAPWKDALRRLTLITDLTDAEAGVLKAVIPDVEALIERDVEDAPGLDPAATRARLLDTVEAIVRRVAVDEGQPILIVMEDLHWAGSESLALLAHLAGQVAVWPVLIIGSYRADERPDLPAELPTMTTVLLPRLDESSIAQLSESMLGTAGRSRAVVDLLQRETEGNVFFMVEVMRALADHYGNLEQIGQSTLPRSIYAGGMEIVVRRRLDRVPEETRDLLAVAAVAGRQLDLDILRAIAPAIDLDDWLTTCAACAVLSADDSGLKEGRWRFAHDKLRETLLRDLAEARRQRIHQQVAEAIEATKNTALYAAQLAHHWGAAGDPLRELLYIGMAGDQAIRSSANPEAIDLFQRGLSRLETLPNFPDRAQVEVAFLSQLGLATMALKGYGAPEVADAFRRAREYLAQLGDARQSFQVLSMLAGYNIARAEYKTAVELGQQMIDLGGVMGSVVGTLGGHLIIGQALAFMGDHEGAERHLREVVDRYDFTRRSRSRLNAIQDPGVAAMLFLAITRWMQGYPQEALDLALRGIAAAELLDHPITTTFAVHWANITRHYRGDYSSSLELAQATLEMSRDRDFALFIPVGQLYHALAGMRLGEIDGQRGLTMLREALESYKATGAVFCIPFFQAVMAEVLAESGEVDEALLLLDDAEILIEHTGERWIDPEICRLRGQFTLLQGGDRAEAERYFREALAGAQDHGARSLALRAAIQLCRVRQGTDRAAEGQSDLRALYETFTEGHDTRDLREAAELLAVLI
jgi:tetratricopeptide (TPR) repeat protein